MARHRPNGRAVKIHRNYTPEEAARTLNIGKATILRWTRNGLPALKDQKPFLILGTDLKNFLKARSGAKAKCRPNEFYCFRCKTPRPAAEGMIDYAPITAHSGMLNAICETCGTLMFKNYSHAKLASLVAIAAVHFNEDSDT